MKARIQGLRIQMKMKETQMKLSKKDPRWHPKDSLLPHNVDFDWNIDINSKALLDMISENDTVSVATANMRTAGAPAAGTSNLKPFNFSVAEAFENW